MIRRMAITDGRIVEDAGGPGQILVAIGPDDDERALIKGQFHLDDYDLGAMIDPDAVPRLEVTEGGALLIWKVPQGEAVDLAVNVAGLSLLTDRLALVQGAGDVSFADREFRKVGDVRDVMLAFLLSTVRHFVAHLRAIKQTSAELQKKITVSMENRHLLQMFNLSESLVYVDDAIEGNEAVLTKLKSVGGQLGFEPRHVELLDEVILENTQAARQASIYSSVLSGLMDARGNIVNNNMNVLLKNLTLINIVFLPLNLIASIGGMSEWSMMTEGLDWRLSYLLLCLGMAIAAWGTWVFMKKVVDRGVVRPARSTSR